MEDNIVSFEQAEILADVYGFSYVHKGLGKPHHVYDTKTKELKEVEDTIPKRSQRVWNGMGWTYQWYLAPTKDEAMLFLMDALDSQRRYYEGKINELKVNK